MWTSEEIRSKNQDRFFLSSINEMLFLLRDGSDSSNTIFFSYLQDIGFLKITTRNYAKT